MTAAPILTSASEPAARRGRFVQVGGQRLHCLEAGPVDGRPVLLLHGLAGMAQEILTPLAEPLSRAGYRVVAVDRPGYGHSTPAPADLMGPRAQARSMRGVVDALGLGRPLVVAHSAGAAAALWMALDPGAPPAGLVLVSPFSRPTRPASVPLLRLAKAPFTGPLVRRVAMPRLAPLIGPRMVRAGLPPGFRPRPDAFPWHALGSGDALLAMSDELLGFNADMARARTGLRRILTPTSILAAEGDAVIDIHAHVRWLARRLPNAAVSWMPTGAHLLHHLNPDAVVEALTAVDVADREHRPMAA